LQPNEDILVLAAGTDGTDGPTEDAGAIVDGGTCERAELAGVDVDRALAQFDSGSALECAGDLVHTGPTGTNVGDLLIGLKRAPGSHRDLARSRVL
jgi:glycerate 2-kinase